MDTNPTAKMVAWLDEERRKDKALITKLEERTASQQALISDQTRRIMDLENQIAGLRSAIIPISTFDETITRLRMEFNASIEQLESRRSNVDLDVKKLRDTDREQFLRTIEELRQEMIQRIDQAMGPYRAPVRVAVELQNYANHLSKGLEDSSAHSPSSRSSAAGHPPHLEINSEVAEPSSGWTASFRRSSCWRRSAAATSAASASYAAHHRLSSSIRTGRTAALADQQRERAERHGAPHGRLRQEMMNFTKQVQGWATPIARSNRRSRTTSLADRVERRLNEYSRCSASPRSASVRSGKISLATTRSAGVSLRSPMRGLARERKDY